MKDSERPVHDEFILTNVFREVFDNDGLTVTPQTSRKDIEGWDSIAQVKLVLAIEEAFGFQFSEEEMASIKNVGDLLECIRKHQGRVA